MQNAFMSSAQLPPGTVYVSNRAQDIDGFKLDPGDVIPLHLPVNKNPTILERLLRVGFISPVVETQQHEEKTEAPVHVSKTKRGRG